jgi:hypothetical protein
MITSMISFSTRSTSISIGASREAGKGQVVNLDVRKRIADGRSARHAASGFGHHLGARRAIR